MTQWRTHRTSSYSLARITTSYSLAHKTSSYSLAQKTTSNSLTHIQWLNDAHNHLPLIHSLIYFVTSIKLKQVESKKTWHVFKIHFKMWQNLTPKMSLVSNCSESCFKLFTVFQTMVCISKCYKKLIQTAFQVPKFYIYCKPRQ